MGRWFGTTVRCVIVYSMVMFLIEIDWARSEHSRAGHPFFLWSERVVALLLTVEYFLRFRSAGEHRWTYARSGFGIIDLLAVLPFWVGFFLPAQSTIYLRMVRTLRVLRLLKLVRYMPRVQLLLRALGVCIKDSMPIGFLCFIVFLFGSVAVFEVERYAQPDKFASLGDSMWWMWITLTTVGYGDLAPITITGRILTVITMIFGLGLVAGYIGILANTVYNVFKGDREAAHPQQATEPPQPTSH